MGWKISELYAFLATLSRRESSEDVFCFKAQRDAKTGHGGRKARRLTSEMLFLLLLRGIPAEVSERRNNNALILYDSLISQYYLESMGFLPYQSEAGGSTKPLARVRCMLLRNIRQGSAAMSFTPAAAPGSAFELGFPP